MMSALSKMLFETFLAVAFDFAAHRKKSRHRLVVHCRAELHGRRPGRIGFSGTAPVLAFSFLSQAGVVALVVISVVFPSPSAAVVVSAVQW